MYTITFKGQGRNSTPGPGHVVTQIGQIAYDSMRLDERNMLRLFPLPYLFSICQLLAKKKLLVTSSDLR